MVDFGEPPGQFHAPGGDTSPDAAQRLDRRAEFLANLADERFFLRFPTLDPPAGQADHSGSHHGRGTADGEKASVADDDGHNAGSRSSRVLVGMGHGSSRRRSGSGDDFPRCLLRLVGRRRKIAGAPLGQPPLFWCPVLDRSCRRRKPRGFSAAAFFAPVAAADRLAFSRDSCRKVPQYVLSPRQTSPD